MRLGIFYVFLLAFALSLLSSCTKEDGYEYQGSFNGGKQAFDDTENNMAVLLSFFDLSLRVNACLSVEEEEFEAMQAEYLPDYRLLLGKGGEWLGLKGQDTLFRLITDDLPLTVETAKWKMIGYGNIAKGEMTMTCQNLGEWSLEALGVEGRYWKSSALLKIQYKGEQLPENFGESDWVIAGAGESRAEAGQREEKKLAFEVAESLVKISNSRYLFDKGVLYLKIKDGSGKEETVKAEMKSRLDKGRLLQVTYREKIYSYSDDSR